MPWKENGWPWLRPLGQVAQMYWAALLIAVTPANCDVPRGELRRQLALDYQQFDTADDGTAWRQLNSKGCADAAVQLLESYDESNAHRLSVEQRSELAFHRGQVLAFASRDAESISHFERALQFGGSDEWITYVRATIAFLRRDSAKLRLERLRYSAIAPGSMREKILGGLEACPGKSYAVATHCAM